MRYRSFLGPSTGPERKPAVVATLIAAPFQGRLEDYAQTYLAGKTLSASREESRQGARTTLHRFASPDGGTRYSLLLLQEGERVCGLLSQGDADGFEAQLPGLDEMERSFALERPSGYPEQRNDKYGFSLRVPASWRQARSFAGSGTYLMQFTSPALLADPNRQTVHASLTLTVEAIPGDGSVETFYKATRVKLGESFKVLSHTPWQGGYADVMRAETSMSVSRVKRFYRAADGRGYSLAFEAREDAYPRVVRWCDMIASTFRVGGEAGQP